MENWTEEDLREIIWSSGDWRYQKDFEDHISTLLECLRKGSLLLERKPFPKLTPLFKRGKKERDYIRYLSHRFRHAANLHAIGVMLFWHEFGGLSRNYEDFLGRRDGLYVSADERYGFNYRCDLALVEVKNKQETLLIPMEIGDVHAYKILVVINPRNYKWRRSSISELWVLPQPEKYTNSSNSVREAELYPESPLNKSIIDEFPMPTAYLQPKFYYTFKKRK